MQKDKNKKKNTKPVLFINTGGMRRRYMYTGVNSDLDYLPPPEEITLLALL